jgi:hypothetical protein
MIPILLVSRDIYRESFYFLFYKTFRLSKKINKSNLYNLFVIHCIFRDARRRFAASHLPTFKRKYVISLTILITKICFV